MSVINSIINAAIAATVPTASVSNAILPYSNLLPAGTYESEILSVADAIQNDNVIGIDCIHKLTNHEGKSFLVKFRFFAPRDTDNLINTLKAYSMTGSVGNVLTGLKEEVEITQRPGSDRYVHIDQRSLVSESSAAQQSHTPKKVGIGGRFSRKSSSLPNEATRKFFEDDDEWNDEEDWLDDDEE